MYVGMYVYSIVFFFFFFPSKNLSIRLTFIAYCLIYIGWTGEVLGGFGVMESFCLLSLFC